MERLGPDSPAGTQPQTHLLSLDQDGRAVCPERHHLDGVVHGEVRHGQVETEHDRVHTLSGERHDDGTSGIRHRKQLLWRECSAMVIVGSACGKSLAAANPHL